MERTTYRIGSDEKSCGKAAAKPKTHLVPKMLVLAVAAISLSGSVLAGTAIAAGEVSKATASSMSNYTFTAAAKANPLSAKSTDNLVAAVHADNAETATGTKKTGYVDDAEQEERAWENAERAMSAAATSETGQLAAATGELSVAMDKAAAEKADQEKKAEEREYQAYIKSEQGKRDALVEAAESRLGVPYVWGGTDPDNGMDCSGFTQWCYSQIGIDIPRTTYSQESSALEVVSVEDAKPGDILYSGGHVGLYIGDGVFIHEPQSGDVCRKSTDMGQFYSALRYL